MNQGSEKYIPSGQLQGDTGSMPDRGTSTRVDDTYGADLSQDATNSMGSIQSATRSDPPDNETSPDPQI